MDNEKNTQNIDEEFDSLKGYFPERYDLSPDQLEKDIEREKKENNIVLGFIGEKNKVQTPVEKAMAEDINKEVKTEKAQTTTVESEVSSPKIIPVAPVKVKSVENGFRVPTEEYVEKTKKIESPIETVLDSEMNSVEDEMFEDVSNQENIIQDELNIPDAESVENNALYMGMKPLDTLFQEMDEEIEEAKNNSEENEEIAETSGHKAVNWLYDFIEIFSVCLLVIILLFSFVFRLTRVDGGSMNDTLIDGQYLVVSNFAYTPTVGDIVVIQNTSLENEVLKKPLVKRIIAVGGQTIDINSSGEVTITEKDGTKHQLDQSFTKDEIYRFEYYHTNHCVVPEGCVFVMGDNRNNSTDSRDSRVGIVDERCIFGKAIARIFPITDFTIFKNPYSE